MARESKTSTFHEVNILLRSMLYLGVFAVLGILGYQVWWTTYGDQYELEQTQAEIASLSERLENAQAEHAAALKEKNDQLQQQETLLAERAEQIDVLDREVQRQRTALKFLKFDRRLAEIEVLEQKPSEDDPETMLSRVRFTEVGQRGEPLGPPIEATIEGQELYVDAQVITFKDEYIEAGDALRGRAIVRFRRMFGDQQRPSEGVSLERPPLSPGESTRLEQELWGNFWQIANDASKADAQGIRAAAGSASSMQLQPGSKYRVDIRATGHMYIRPVENEEPPAE